MAVHRKNKLQIPSESQGIYLYNFYWKRSGRFLINYVLIITLRFLITMVYIHKVHRYLHIILRKSHYVNNFQNKYHLIKEVIH